jgi:hypothetical protein
MLILGVGAVFFAFFGDGGPATFLVGIVLVGASAATLRELGNGAPFDLPSGDEPTDAVTAARIERVTKWLWRLSFVYLLAQYRMVSVPFSLVGCRHVVSTEYNSQGLRGLVLPPPPMGSLAGESGAPGSSGTETALPGSTLKQAQGSR